MSDLINFKRYYDVFRDISMVVHAATNVEEVSEIVVWKAAEMLSAKGAVLRIFNLEKKDSDLFATYGLGKKHIAKSPVSKRESALELCRLRKVIVIEDIETNPRVNNKQELKEEGIQMLLDVPLVLRNNLMGIIRIYFDKIRKFSDEELNFVAAISETCACAIDKARLIEEQKHQYDQLALQTEKLSALGRMAAGIAHEINNPLAGILLFSTNMRKKVQEQKPIKEGLDVIIRETQRCKGIIQDLLEFSRDREPDMVLWCINDIIENALNILGNEFRIHHISVEKRLSADLPDIPLDGNLMQQVLVNLLINAIEAIQENGSIIVQSDLSPDRNSEIIEIRDTGCGIPDDDVAKIFEPFFSTKSNGTGLGLAVSYGIIQKHNGHLHVSSQPGRGTQFTIEIPVDLGT